MIFELVSFSTRMIHRSATIRKTGFTDLPCALLGGAVVFSAFINVLPISPRGRRAPTALPLDSPNSVAVLLEVQAHRPLRAA